MAATFMVIGAVGAFAVPGWFAWWFAGDLLGGGYSAGGRRGRRW